MALQHGAVREALIKTALELMEKGGLDRVKARVVAQLAGVSVGTIYNLFGSFDQLILSANLKIYEELGAMGRTRMSQVEATLTERLQARQLEDTPRARMLVRLSGLADAYLDFVAENANRWAALLAFNRTRNIRDSEVNQQQLDALIGIVGAVIEDAPAWTSPERRRLAARALWSAVHGIVTTNFFGGEEATARERTRALLELLLTAVVDGAFVSGDKA